MQTLYITTSYAFILSSKKGQKQAVTIVTANNYWVLTKLRCWLQNPPNNPLAFPPMTDYIFQKQRNDFPSRNTLSTPHQEEEFISLSPFIWVSPNLVWWWEHSRSNSTLNLPGIFCLLPPRKLGLRITLEARGHQVRRPGHPEKLTFGWQVRSLAREEYMQLSWMYDQLSLQSPLAPATVWLPPWEAQIKATQLIPVNPRNHVW